MSEMSVEAYMEEKRGVVVLGSGLSADEAAKLYVRLERYYLEAEIERLRAALQEIAEDPYAVDGGASEIARRALGTY